MLGCGTDFYIPTGKSLTLPEYPGIQLSSHTVYLETTSPTKLTSTSDANLKPRLLPMLLTDWLQTVSSSDLSSLGYRLRVQCYKTSLASDLKYRLSPGLLIS